MDSNLVVVLRRFCNLGAAASDKDTLVGLRVAEMTWLPNDTGISLAPGAMTDENDLTAN